MIARQRISLAVAVLLSSLGMSVSPARAGSQLLVAESLSNSIARIDANGNVTTFASGIPTPIGLAVDQSEDVYVTTFRSFFFGTGSIERFSPTGQDLGTFASGLSAPSDLAIDKAGNIYVIESLTNSIEKFSPTGQDLGTFASLLNSPNRMAFDSAGNLYVTDGSQLDKYSPTGAQLGSFFLGGAPIGLAIDSSDTLYVANTAYNIISKYSTSGQSLGVFASSGLDFTESLAFDQAGNLYASNNLANSIEKFSPSGQDLGVFASGLNGPEVLAFAAGSVPEPGSVTLLVLGVAGLMIGRRGFRPSRGKYSKETSPFSLSSAENRRSTHNLSHA
jgi:DNA-binding beta-propeller fold protein YncE